MTWSAGLPWRIFDICGNHSARPSAIIWGKKVTLIDMWQSREPKVHLTFVIKYRLTYRRNISLQKASILNLINDRGNFTQEAGTHQRSEKWQKIWKKIRKTVFQVVTIKLSSKTGEWPGRVKKRWISSVWGLCVTFVMINRNDLEYFPNIITPTKKNKATNCFSLLS